MAPTSHKLFYPALRRESEILSEYPDLQPEDLRECLRFALASAMEREMPLSFAV
jgi:uncharacterized protein (DUF433 family)